MICFIQWFNHVLNNYKLHLLYSLTVFHFAFFFFFAFWFVLFFRVLFFCFVCLFFFIYFCRIFRARFSNFRIRTNKFLHRTLEIPSNVGSFWFTSAELNDYSQAKVSVLVSSFPSYGELAYLTFDNGYGVRYTLFFI